MTETVQVLNDQQLTPAQKAYFAERYSIECEIEDLKAEHIAPLNEDLKALKGKFKAESGIDLNVSNALYALYKLDRSASRLLEKEDEEKRLDDLERAFHALAQGQQLDWIKASDKPAADPMLEDPDQADSDQYLYGGDGVEHKPVDDEAEPEREPAGPTFASAEPREESDPMLEETRQAWAAADDSRGGEEDLDQGGYTFAEGKKAGQGGASAEQNIRPAGTASHDLWERGRAVGFKEFVASEARAVADEHEAETEEGGAEIVQLFDEGDETRFEFSEEEGVPLPIDAEPAHAAI